MHPKVVLEFLLVLTNEIPFCSFLLFLSQNSISMSLTSVSSCYFPSNVYRNCTFSFSSSSSSCLISYCELPTPSLPFHLYIELSSHPPHPSVQCTSGRPELAKRQYVVQVRSNISLYGLIDCYHHPFKF